MQSLAIEAACRFPASGVTDIQTSPQQLAPTVLEYSEDDLKAWSM